MEELHCVSCWILFHRQSNQKQRQLQAHSGLSLGWFLDQNRRKPQVMSLCWLLLTHRALAAAGDAQVQRQARAPSLPKPGAASWHHPKVSSSQWWQQTPATAQNTWGTHKCKYWTTVKSSLVTQSSFTFSFPAKSSQNFLEPDRLSQLEHIQYSEVLTTLPS